MSEEESEAPEKEEEENASGSKGGTPWVMLIIVLLVTPIITIVGVELVMVPKLKSSLQTENPSEAGEAEKKEEKAEKKEGAGGDEKKEKKDDGGKGGKDGAYEVGNAYKFEGLVTNLAGTLGSRFLRASFEVVSEDDTLRAMILKKEAQVKDAVTGVMSTRKLQELEAIGGRNQLRVSIIEAINDALGISVVEELYFIELIVQ